MEETIEKVSDVMSDTTILNENSYETLDKMLSSKDEADHKVAREILNQLKIRESIYYIYKLARKHSHRMVYLRTKASRQFVKDTDLWNLSTTREWEFPIWLQKKGWLTTELFQKFKDYYLERVKQISRNEFYDIHVTIKDDYRDLDPYSEMLKLTDNE